MTERARQREQLLVFLGTIQKPGHPLDALNDDTSFVESGLIDSLAVLEIVAYLETTYGVDFAERGVEPEQLFTINGILDVLAAAGP